MKRDNDLIRDLLFHYEKQADWQFVMPGSFDDADADEDKEHYHVLLLSDQGFIVRVGKHEFRLTSQGHDFLDAVRSDTIWDKTKSGASKIGGATLGMMLDLAKAYIKQEAKEKLGIAL